MVRKATWKTLFTRFVRKASLMIEQTEDYDSRNGHPIAEDTSAPQEGPAAPEDDVNIAALKATMFLLPLAALTSPILIHLVLDETYPTEYTEFSGDLAVLIGVFLATCIWWEFAHYYRRYTTAANASRRNFNGLRER